MPQRGVPHSPEFHCVSICGKPRQQAPQPMNRTRASSQETKNNLRTACPASFQRPQLRTCEKIDVSRALPPYVGISENSDP